MPTAAACPSNVSTDDRSICSRASAGVAGFGAPEAAGFLTGCQVKTGGAVMMAAGAKAEGRSAEGG